MVAKSPDTPRRDPRPLSPHLQVWKFHATMASSILHRVSGVVNYIGAVLVAVWLILLAAGPQAYAGVEALQGGVIGALVTLILIGFTLSLTYHMLNGIRHLSWDMGLGFDPGGSNLRSWIIFIAAIVITAAVWIVGGGVL